MGYSSPPDGQVDSFLRSAWIFKQRFLQCKH